MVEHLRRNRDNAGMTILPSIDDVDVRDLAPLRLCVAVFGLLLVTATWPLWCPTGDSPSIPWFRGLLAIPASVDRLLACGMVLSGLAVAWLAARQWRQLRHDSRTGTVWGGYLNIANAAWMVCLAASMLLDQQRLQVWAWEFLWLTIFLTIATPRMALCCCRVLVIGIYFYSAISKFDAGFVQTQGPWLWQGLQRALGVEVSAWGSSSSPGTLAFPLGELLVAGLLGFPRTRRWGIAGSTAMHLTLLVALGPLGWNQLPGVLLWNLFFLVSVPQLFWRPRALSGPATEWLGLTHEGEARHPIRDRFCQTAIVGLSLWPALEGVGLCDHWPAWAVYSSRPEVVVIQIQDEQVAQLPLGWRPHVGPAEALSSWRPVSIDQWSFETRRCPTYPQGRYRLAVARHLEDTYGVTLRVTERSMPDRWTGQRQARVIEDIAAECDQRFWWNTQSRGLLRTPLVSWGDRLIAHTAQLSVACYLIALLLAARSRSKAQPSVGVACFWTAGLFALTIHVACAFHFLHHWSHAKALTHTAQRTAEVTGWNWPGGLYINYAFLLFWAVDAVRVWREALGRTSVASPWRKRVVHGVFLFMMFNATVVFGPWHWTVVGLVFAVAWWTMWRIHDQAQGLQPPGLARHPSLTATPDSPMDDRPE